MPDAYADNREIWLRNVAEGLKALLDPHLEEPLDLSQIAISPGLPKHSPNGTIGQCWPASSSRDGKTRHVFICPTQQDSFKVAHVLLHELIHAGVKVKGHRGPFRKAALAVGLSGPMRSTSCTKDSPLGQQLLEILEAFGDYPHTALSPRSGPKRPPSGGWVKFRSVAEPGYILKISPRALEDHGPPCDFAGVEMVFDPTDSRKRR